MSEFETKRTFSPPQESGSNWSNEARARFPQDTSLPRFH
jgi:hypothetical protein